MVSLSSGDKKERYPTISIIDSEILCFSMVRYEIPLSFFCILSATLVLVFAHVYIFFCVIRFLLCISAISHENQSMGSHSFNVVIVVNNEEILLLQRFCVRVVD